MEHWTWCVDCARQFKTQATADGAAKCPECRARYEERHAKLTRSEVRRRDREMVMWAKRKVY